MSRGGTRAAWDGRGGTRRLKLTSSSREESRLRVPWADCQLASVQEALAYTKYLRLDRQSLSLHASSSSFASIRISKISILMYCVIRTYVELPGEGGESALSIDQWQDLFRQVFRLFNDDQASFVVPPDDLFVGYGIGQRRNKLT